MDLSFNWHYANKVPALSCHYKCEPEDFRVDEVPVIEPQQFSGNGEHIFLTDRKKTD
ncbi:hypothetical protein [Piscirickettsia litoralis]|uniref:hypothetical protein n=1 Tax=Piscirickettsia litoralis TaxID=1891921 RepID=UPI001F1C9C4B|nr:hypothetical protein [Piscirickettsia litoralis]